MEASLLASIAVGSSCSYSQFHSGKKRQRCRDFSVSFCVGGYRFCAIRLLLCCCCQNNTRLCGSALISEPSAGGLSTLTATQCNSILFLFKKCFTLYPGNQLYILLANAKMHVSFAFVISSCLKTSFTFTNLDLLSLNLPADLAEDHSIPP